MKNSVQPTRVQWILFRRAARRALGNRRLIVFGGRCSGHSVVARVDGGVGFAVALGLWQLPRRRRWVVPWVLLLVVCCYKPLRPRGDRDWSEDQSRPFVAIERHTIGSQYPEFQICMTPGGILYRRAFFAWGRCHCPHVSFRFRRPFVGLGKSEENGESFRSRDVQTI